jgi:hypothetical protein
LAIGRRSHDFPAGGIKGKEFADVCFGSKAANHLMAAGMGGQRT